jgi:hypothetical protein
LILAFFAAIAGPLIALTASTIVYMRDLRAERLARFAGEARAAFANREADVLIQQERFAGRVRGELRTARCADVDCYRRVWAGLSTALPGARGPVTCSIVSTHGQIRVALSPVPSRGESPPSNQLGVAVKANRAPEIHRDGHQGQGHGQGLFP